MKLPKMLGLAALAAAALMAFAGPASATTLTSPSGTTYTSTIKATSTNLAWDGSFTTIKCGHSAIEGKVEAHGAEVTAKVGLSSVTFTECNFPFLVKKAGVLEIHTDSTTVDGNGTITWSGLELQIESSVGSCIFTTNNTDVGTLTGSDSANAGWDINSAKIPRTGGNFLCGSSSTLTGTYTIITPSTLTVD